MKFFPIIALCDLHAAELKEYLVPMPDPVEQSQQEKIVRAACDAFDSSKKTISCQRAKHWYYLHLELEGWRVKEAGAKGGSARTQAKANAARNNGAKGGRPTSYFQSVFDAIPGEIMLLNEELLNRRPQLQLKVEIEQSKSLLEYGFRLRCVDLEWQCTWNSQLRKVEAHLHDHQAASFKSVNNSAKSVAKQLVQAVYHFKLMTMAEDFSDIEDWIKTKNKN
jgi:hypothetical protein